jgi:hypothetical protein
MIPANLSHPNLNPNPHPNPYNPPTIPQSYYPLSDDQSQTIPDLPQNGLARTNLDLYNLMKGPRKGL